MQAHFATAGDGVRVPLTWFPAARPRARAVVMPALGIQAKLYFPLASALAASGCSVLVLEQRGHGRSALRARRGSRYGLSEFLDLDIPAALAWLDGQAPDLPLLLGGHSLGGHLATLYAGCRPERLSGVFHIATGAPYYRDFPARQAWLIRLLCVLVSLFRVVPGYFPGQWVGFGGRDTLQTMRDWRRWALGGRLEIGAGRGLNDAVGAYRGPVLSVSLAEDAYSCPAAVDRALSPFTHARLERHTLGPESQGAYLGHFRWARRPAGVAETILEWMDRAVLGKQPGDQG